MRIWRRNNPEKATFSALRYNASLRKIDFKLTFNQWLKFLKRFPDYLDKKGRLFPIDLQIDRINPDRGYTYRNIRVIAFAENRRRQNEPF